MVVAVRDRIFLLCLLGSEHHSGEGKVFSQAMEVDMGYCFLLAHTGRTIATTAKFQ